MLTGIHDADVANNASPMPSERTFQSGPHEKTAALQAGANALAFFGPIPLILGIPD